jgi:DoxX-like family
MSTLNPNLTAIPTPGALVTVVPSKAARWAGRVLSAVIALLLGFDALMKLVRIPPVMKATIELGYPTQAVFGIGVVLAICVVAFVVPRTSLLGAVLLTGYLGGAIATHVRIGDPLWTHTLFPIYVAAVIWAGLLLRDGRLRGFLQTYLAR